MLPEEVCKADNSVYLHFTVLNRHRPWPLSTEEIIGEGFFKYSDMRTNSNEDAVVHLTLPSYRPGTYGHWLVKEIGISYRIVSNKRSPSNKRLPDLFSNQIKLGKMPKFLYGVSL